LKNLSHKTWLSVSTVNAKWLERSLNNTITTRNQSQRWHGGYPVVRPRPTLAYSTLWRPNGRGLQSTPLALTLEIHKEAQSKGGLATHTRHKNQCQHAHKSQPELATQLNEFTTPLELYMLSQ
jgi:hypothetical protein